MVRNLVASTRSGQRAAYLGHRASRGGFVEPAPVRQHAKSLQMRPATPLAASTGTLESYAAPMRRRFWRTAATCGGGCGARTGRWNGPRGRPGRRPDRAQSTGAGARDDGHAVGDDVGHHGASAASPDARGLAADARPRSGKVVVTGSVNRSASSAARGMAHVRNVGVEVAPHSVRVNATAQIFVADPTSFLLAVIQAPGFADRLRRFRRAASPPAGRVCCPLHPWLPGQRRRAGFARIFDSVVAAVSRLSRGVARPRPPVRPEGASNSL